MSAWPWSWLPRRCSGAARCSTTILTREAGPVCPCYGLREGPLCAKVPPGYLAELEAGKKKNPSLDVLKRLARALGVPVGELLE